MEKNIENIEGRLKYLITIIGEGNLDDKLLLSITNELEEIKEELDNI